MFNAHLIVTEQFSVLQGVPGIVAFINNNIFGFASLLKQVKICQKFKAQALVGHMRACILTNACERRLVRWSIFINNTKSISFAIWYSLQKARFLLRPTISVTQGIKLSKVSTTVKLGYNELGYNKHSIITNKNIYLVGLGDFDDKFSRL